MNAMEMQAWKFAKEYKRAKAENRPLNFREMAGSFLVQFDLPEAAQAAETAMEKCPDPILGEAVALLKKMVARAAINSSVAVQPAGTPQVATPSPAAAQGGAQL